MHEQTHSSVSKVADSTAVMRNVRLGGSAFRVPTTPYSVFVRQSPVYVTSEMTGSRRRGRPAARLDSRRRHPFRPDGYPYANRRWTNRLMASAKTGENTGESV